MADRLMMLGLLALMAIASAHAQTDLGRLREQRKEAAHRKRRIIMNNDGNEPVHYCTKVDRDEFLSKRTAPLAGSQVDTICYCTWSSGFGFFTHGTKVGEVFTTLEAPFERNLTADFLAAGKLADGWLSCTVRPEAANVGANEVAVTLAGDAGPVWADLTVKVTYPKG